MATKKTITAPRVTNGLLGRITYFKTKCQLTFRETKPWVYCIRPVRGSVVKDEAFIKYAAQAANVPETTIRMAKRALFDALNYFCTQGHAVEVLNLGTFRPETTMKTVQDVSDATAETFKKKRYRFYPSGLCHDLGNAKSVTLEEDKTITKTVLPTETANDPRYK